MILYTPKNELYLNKDDISSDWQKRNISEISLRASI